MSNARDHTSLKDMVGEAAEPSANTTFALLAPSSLAGIRFSQVTFCPTLTFKVGGLNSPSSRMTTRALFNLKLRVEFVCPFAELAMISTGRVDAFTLGATEIPRSTAS